MFHAAHFEQYVKGFEKLHDCTLTTETVDDMENEYPIKRVDISTRDQNKCKFLSEFLMNALFIQLIGATKYLVSLLKNGDTVLPQNGKKFSK